MLAATQVALIRMTKELQKAHLLTPGAFNTQGCSAGRAPNQLCSSRTCTAANTRHMQRVGSLHGARPSAPQPKRAQRKLQSTSALPKTPRENIRKQSRLPPAFSRRLRTAVQPLPARGTDPPCSLRRKSALPKSCAAQRCQGKEYLVVRHLERLYLVLNATLNGMNVSEATTKKIQRDYGTVSHCISLCKHCTRRTAPTSVNSHYLEKKKYIRVSSDDNNATRQE